MIFYGLIVFVGGIILSMVSYASVWFWILQGVALVFSRRFLWLVIVFMAGMHYDVWYQHQVTGWQLPQSQIKKPLQITGKIVSIPKIMPRMESFEFMSSQQHLFKLAWYQPYQPVHYGDQWRLTVSLKPPTGLYNPGSFNYRDWLIRHGIKATGYVKSQFHQQLLTHAAVYSASRWRERLGTLIQQSIKQPQLAALIVALTIGSHNLLQSSQWQVLQRTGTNHLIAIAGLHLGFVVMFVYVIVGWVWSRSQTLLLLWPRQYMQAASVMMMALAYGWLAGFSLPTQRAVIMVIVMMITILMRYPVLLWQRFIFAFCIIVLYHPFDLEGSSLWMSFGSVFFIMYVCQQGATQRSRWQRWWRLQLALAIGLAPLTLFFYHQVSLIGFFANALAVPWVGFVVLPLCLLATLASLLNSVWAMMVFKLAALCIDPLWHYLIWLAQQSWGVWQHDISGLGLLITALAAVCVLLMPRGVWLRWLGLVLLIPLVLYTPPAPKSGQLWVTALDVGQGLAVVVRTQHHTLVYDTGPKTYSGFDAGAEVVVPYLRYFGIHSLDLLMVSHGDNDHIGGAAAVLAAMPVTRVMTSIPSKFKVQAAHCYRGQEWRWDGVQFEVLWPPRDQPYQDNNSSCVLKITDGQERVLLTGDIEAAVERRLLQDSGPALAATLLVAPHHGSRSSSSSAFVSRVRPQLVIFSTGAYNRYHFPAPIVEQRYSNLSAKLYNTATDGAVSVHFDRNRILKIKTVL